MSLQNLCYESKSLYSCNEVGLKCFHHPILHHISSYEKILCCLLKKAKRNQLVCVAHGKGATFCPASREHCVQPSINATSLLVICLLSSVLPSLQWINGTPVLPASQSHWFLPRGYKIMNRSVLLFFISIGGGYIKGFRLCFKGLFSFLFVSLLKCFYWNNLSFVFFCIITALRLCSYTEYISWVTLYYGWVSVKNVTSLPEWKCTQLY